MKNPKFVHAFEVADELSEALRPLKKLARNFYWTWSHEIRALFRSIDKGLWDRVEHCPFRMVRHLGEERRARLLEDPAFLSRLKHCEALLDGYLAAPTWFDEAYPGERGSARIAYFCAEFGISESLPIYSGGLGVLAGDHLKAASDLGLPLVGMGLLYARGYFRQRLSHDGWQQEIYPQYDFYQMPLELVRQEDDRPLRISVEMPDRVVTCQIWRADVGRVPVYLLDSNVLENEPGDQSITDTLYGGDEEMRLRQEMILGIGGMRALQALGIQPTVCHMNEGHAAFLSIERIRQFMERHGCDYETARQVCLAGNVFTTHTPVPAGFDLFPAELLEKYLGSFVPKLGIDFGTFLTSGQMPNGESASEGRFNMAVLAMGHSNWLNGVSKLHGAVSREMFHRRWPSVPEEEVPIEAITNGVHTLTWVSQRMQQLFDEFLGSGWALQPQNPERWRRAMEIPDEALWAAIEDQRGELVRFIRKRLQREVRRQNLGKTDFGAIGGVLDPRVLTIGFARRFASYKRATLLLNEPARLKKLLFSSERPMQIVIAGKAHPRDDAGKSLIQELTRFVEVEGARSRMVFLEDYDMRIARALVQGVDLWLNNPRRPMEASGTSGMKVIPNGGLNCSILDGWWDEAFQPGLGFAVGDQERPPGEGHDWEDAHSLYGVLEYEVAHRFYERGADGVPHGWLAMIKRSICELAPQFSTGRMVEEYARKFYLPASKAFTEREADGCALGREMLGWKRKVQGAWPGVSVVEVHDTAGRSVSPGQTFKIRAKARLAGLDPSEVTVEAVLGKIGPNRDLIGLSPSSLAYAGEEDGASVFEGEVVCEQPGPRGYTVRVLPRHAGLDALAELPLVRWEED